MSSVSELIDQAITRLHEAGVPSPEADVWSMVASVLGVSRGRAQAQALVDPDLLTTVQREQLEKWVTRREAREPLWHITGKAPFLTLELDVGQGVFTPRPETELLAHQAISDLQVMVPAGEWLEVADLCAGSGAVGLAIASQIPHARVLMVEASAEAARYATANAEAIAPAQTEVLRGDLSVASDHRQPGTLDMVVSNPPYLIEGVDLLDQETSQFDPPEALFANDSGMAVITQVIAEARRLLRPGGVVLIEHGIGQGEPTRAELVQAGFRQVETHADLLGRDRFSRAVAGSR